MTWYIMHWRGWGDCDGDHRVLLRVQGGSEPTRDKYFMREYVARVETRWNCHIPWWRRAYKSLSWYINMTWRWGRHVNKSWR